ncbi:zinc finger matrin-type protein 4-like isoform X1 [Colossoma macropomum]|uniref:zinc finger matrin-type protein 4-like isoform X1 n=2 Tax=Colossoma macropomum TaxID=42526 RepID=UPI0018647DB1|nr:zinc finger matrin-type protein 4-like isoform X1 [Colossoma macropomum]XP_036451786.1 zinc finger matrin-type protein 4-like isoform X1 [Colossoma macropomum]
MRKTVSSSDRCAEMKSTDVDASLFTASYCRVCSAQLISQSQRVAHYKSRKHANKVRLYYMLHPVDGGCPAKKLRTDNGSNDGDVDKNKCCTLCNMSFTSAVVAQSHYQGKIHAKRLKLLLGETTPITTTDSPGRPEQVVTDVSVVSPLRQTPLSLRFCLMCKACFNNPGMAQQHYSGKKHKKNTARAHLLAQLGETLDTQHTNVLKQNRTCEVCSVTLNSVAQYHAHLQGSKHQNNLKNK